MIQKFTDPSKFLFVCLFDEKPLLKVMFSKNLDKNCLICTCPKIEILYYYTLTLFSNLSQPW